MNVLCLCYVPPHISLQTEQCISHSAQDKAIGLELEKGE
jgi:hypothetical protein